MESRAPPVAASRTAEVMSAGLRAWLAGEGDTACNSIARVPG